MWMTSAIPGGAPGYDGDKEFGNNVAHTTHRTSRRLRDHSPQCTKVKARAGPFRDASNVSGFLPFGERFLMASFRGAGKTSEPGMTKKPLPSLRGATCPP
jgi:hypothetical protein